MLRLYFAQDPWCDTRAWVITPQRGIYGDYKDDVFQVADWSEHAYFLWRLMGKGEENEGVSVDELNNNADDFLRMGGLEVRSRLWGVTAELNIRYNSTALSKSQVVDRIVDKVLSKIKRLPETTMVYVADYKTHQNWTLSLEEFFNL